MGEMLKYQNELQTLPIPELKDTLAKYLEWIKPLLTKEELENTKSIVEEFGKSGGIGEKLHQRLLEYKNTIKDNNSWLFPMWDDMYLEGRCSIIPDVSFSALLNNKKYKEKYSLEEILARVAYSTTGIYHQIVDKSLPVDMIKGNPLCMEQYLRMFKSMRMVNANRDEFYVGKFDKTNNYCVVFKDNNIYKIMLSDENGQRIGISSLIIALESLKNNKEVESFNPFLYTSTTRDLGKEILDQILVTEENLRNFNEVKDALFVMCIDKGYKDVKESTKDILLSDGNNRCFDKSVQFIINESKEIGANIEHTGFDGSTMFSVLELINNDLETGIIDVDSIKRVVFPKKLDFLLSRDAKISLFKLKEEQREKKEAYHFNFEYFTEFGGNKAKELKMSPDAFFHIALQTAQYKTFGKIRSTYESVAVREFRQGRTECARSSSMEKAEFAKAFVEKNVSGTELYNLLQSASMSHVARIKDCKKGLGVERHLFGLAQIQARFGSELGINEVPELYTDKGYKELKYDFLSTSGVGGKYISHCAFGPQTIDGLGIFYTMGKDEIVINSAARIEQKDKADEFVNNLMSSFIEIKEFVEEYMQAEEGKVLQVF